jgi:4-amino-4-deoxy-L-arabinose transferase-like glycosyltransferase
MRAPSEARLPWLLAAAVLACWAPALGLRSLWYPDEPDVALPILEMFVRGDWIVPTQNGQPWLDYPPLAYWGGLLWSTLAGAPNGLWLRLTPLLAGIVFLLCSARLAGMAAAGASNAVPGTLANPATAGSTNTTFSSKAAAYAAILVVGTPLFWFQTTNLQVDMGFAASQAAGFLLYLAADSHAGRERLWRQVAAFACFGVAILAKGPLGLLLPGLILTVWHASFREWRRLFLLAPLALVALGVALLWWWPLVNRLGAEFVGHEFWAQNFDRFGHTSRGHGGKSPALYLLNLPGDLGLWCVLLPAAFAMAWRRFADRRLRLLLLWFGISFLFLTAASTKRSVYLLPAYPALFALLGAWLATQPAAAWLRALLRFAVVLFALLALVVLAGPYTALGSRLRLLSIAGPLQWPLVASGLLLATGAVLAWRATRRVAGGDQSVPKRSDHPEGQANASFGSGAGTDDLPRLLRGVGTSAATFFLLFTLAQWFVLPVIDTVRDYRPAAAWLAQHSPANERVGFYWPGREATKRPAWLCYLPGHRLETFTDAASATAWLAEKPGRLLLSNPENADAVGGARTVQQWKISSTQWVVVAAR